jgi:ATP-dependent DNA ligase
MKWIVEDPAPVRPSQFNHGIKHDGYCLVARRSDDRVRLYNRRGFNWVDRYPRIVEALHSFRCARS